ANVGARTVMNIEIKVVAVDVILADQFGFISLIDRGLEMFTLANELTADINVADMRAHGEARDEAAFDEEMRVVPHDLAILAGPGLRLVSVDDEIMRPTIRLFRHERPFEPGRKPSAATSAQA